ncbi:hypothetical protein LXL04_027496 [Taraxacum kok-saghyz]
MDESWRMRIGTTATNIPPRRSADEPNRQNRDGGCETLDPEDFDDVFGGPPRSVLSRQYSVEGGFPRSRSLVFEDIFRKAKGCTDLGGRSDRTLPEFRIPEGGGRRMNEEEFYSDIFGNARRSRSRSKSHTNSNSKSKSNSSSILSSEELSPFRPAVVDDDDVSISSFASKLRPINVASKWKNTSTKMQTKAAQPNHPCNCNSFAKTQTIDNDYTHKFKGGYTKFSQRTSSPEIISFGLDSYTSLKESIEDLQVNSPESSVVSSFRQEQDEGKSIDPESEEEDDEVMSAYVIEINPSNRERIGDGIGIDDAIAWAKQKRESHNLEKVWRKEDEEYEYGGVEDTARTNEVPEVPIASHGSRESPLFDKRKDWTSTAEESPEKDISPCKQMELELLDEDINLWSEGKESNIRLLLSTLHHILWPSSGWIMIPLTNLKESSNVKKAYQKARLCLHPDKLQQRGATIPQKYVAEKAFPILQDAWATFISEDVRASVT